MPYSAGKFPDSWKNVPEGVRSKAVEILNALLKGGKMEEGIAIATALKQAREFIAAHNDDTNWEEFMAEVTKEHSMRKFSAKRKITNEEDYMALSREEMLVKCKKDHPDWTAAEHEAWADKMMKKKEGAYQDDEDHIMEYSNAIKGVEIFSTGTHNGDEYTEEDLEQIVTAFKELDYKPAIKVGHTKDNEEKTSTPAYGWVRNLRKVGTKLVADFEDMHDSVVEAIRKRLYDRVSSEIYFNLKRTAKDGVQKIYAKALKAVALLGAEVPAVSNLVPLHKMEFAEQDSFEGVGAFEADLEIPTETLVDTLAQRVAGMINLMKEYDMSKHAEKIAALQAQVAEFNTKMAEMKKKKAEDMDDDDKALMKKLSEDLSKTEAEIKALSEDETDIEQMRKDLSAANAKAEAATAEAKKTNERLAKLEQASRAEKLGSKVKECKVPAFQPGLEALYSYALEHGDATVKLYAKDKEGKTISEDKPLTDMIDGLVSQINAQHEKLFKALAFTGKQEKTDGTIVDTGGDVSAEVDIKVKAYQAEHKDKKIGYSAAMKLVLASDEDLAKRYSEQQGRAQ